MNPTLRNPLTEMEYSFSDKEFNRIRTFVKTLTGISLSKEKKNMVYSRLTRRLRALKISSFKEYCKLIESNDESELTKFTNAITTNLTSFFREKHHFEFLKTNFIPEFTKKNRDNRTLKVWSCASSTGEEPYSIAMTIMDSLPVTEKWSIDILATDLDSDVLSKAKKGIYKEENISEINSHMKRKWFLKGKGDNDNLVKVNPELQELILFKKTNLLERWPDNGPFDIVFCRNVVIYFDKPTQRILFDRIANAMRPGSYLFIGHSESLFKVSDRFKLIGNTIYQRI